MDYLINLTIALLSTVLPIALILGGILLCIYSYIKMDNRKGVDLTLLKKRLKFIFIVIITGVTVGQLFQPAITYKHTTGYDRELDIRNIQRNNERIVREPNVLMKDLMSDEEINERNKRLREAQNYIKEEQL